MAVYAEMNTFQIQFFQSKNITVRQRDAVCKNIDQKSLLVGISQNFKRILSDKQISAGKRDFKNIHIVQVIQ